MSQFGPINPSRVLYIKLGGGGMWEHDCIEQGTLRLGYGDTDHNSCLQGDWDNVYRYYQDMERDQGASTRHVNQIREFYESDNGVLWVTFHSDCLWWCFAETEITLMDDYSKIRPAIGGWQSQDIEGKLLSTSRLKGSLLALQNFRGTICKVREAEYLINKINGKIPPEVTQAEEARDVLYERIKAIVNHLDWRDFEILIDLIFRQAGWQRIGELGGQQRDIDLGLYSPIANEKYAVQVKSKANRNVFEDYLRKFEDAQGYARFYFIVHSPDDNLTKDLEDDDFKIIFPKDIARWVVEYGLTDWVISKVG